MLMVPLGAGGDVARDRGQAHLHLRQTVDDIAKRTEIVAVVDQLVEVGVGLGGGAIERVVLGGEVHTTEVGTAAVGEGVLDAIDEELKGARPVLRSRMALEAETAAE